MKALLDLSAAVEQSRADEVTGPSEKPQNLVHKTPLPYHCATVSFFIYLCHMPEATQTRPVSEHDIAELERILAQKRSLYEQQKTSGEIAAVPQARELVSEIVKEKLAAAPGAQPPAQQASVAQQQPVPQSAPQTRAVPSYASDDLHAKVQELVELAFSKSLGEAIELVKATQNAALIDAFHDIMVDELYDHLVETGKLEKI